MGHGAARGARGWVLWPPTAVLGRGDPHHTRWEPLDERSTDTTRSFRARPFVPLIPMSPL